MSARLSVVTLGCRDLARQRRFYAALGWEDAHPDNAGWTSFRTTGGILALWGDAQLAQEAGFADAPAPAAPEQGPFRGFTLAANVDSPAQVDALLARAREAGSPRVIDGEGRDWGGYSGYFLDPEGNAWEVAHAPGARFDERGGLLEL